MTAPRPAIRALTALVVAGLLVAAACGSSDGEAGVTAVAGGPMTTAASPDTAPPPAETAAPDTTAAPPDTPVAPPGPGVVVTPSGVVVPVVDEVDGGWRVRTPCGAERTITEGTHVPRTEIVLDPGHGGNEKGAISPRGLAEAVVNMAVARVSQAELERSGVAVVLTRTGDYDLGLSVRAQIAKALGPKALVSIHNNADPDEHRPVPGTETYYQMASEDSKRLAGLIQEEVFRALSVYRIDWVGDTDAGAKIRQGERGDYYAMLRQPAPVISVLAELAFVSNPPEAELMSRPDVQAVAGVAVARGILRYLNTSDPGSGFTTAYPRPPDTGGPPGPPAPPCMDPAF